MLKSTLVFILLFFGLTFIYSQHTKKSDSLKSIQVDTSTLQLTEKIDTIKNYKHELISSASTKIISYFTEWEKGFISGLIATLIGFILTMLWDIYKNQRDRITKDKIIKTLIKDTLSENETYIDSIELVLTHEVAVLSQRQSIVTNITTLKNDFWDFIKFNIPKDLLKNNGLLKNLQDILSLTKSINENIHSRETYRLNNGAMDNFVTRLGYYDNLILSEIEKLRGFIIIFKSQY